MEDSSDRTVACSCPIAGYCKRHRVFKTHAWHRLCQTNEAYRSAWENNRGPGHFASHEDRAARAARAEAILALQHELWKEIHTFTFRNRRDGKRKFRTWLKRIPGEGGCPCAGNFRAMLKELPADFSSEAAFFARSVEWHNDVNERLGKPIVTLEEALAIWRPQIVHALA